MVKITEGGITAEEVSQGFNLQGKVALVTGATSGIGKETARVLALRNCHVIIGSRSQEKGEEIRKELIAQLGEEKADLLEVFVADLSSLALVRDAAARFGQRKDRRLHILINNAGTLPSSRTKTSDGFEENFGVNHLATSLLTLLLVPYLKASAPSRVIVVSSESHQHIKYSKFEEDYNLDNAEFEANYFYANSKLAILLFAQELHNRLKGYGVSVNSVHPGVVISELRVKHIGKQATLDFYDEMQKRYPNFKIIPVEEGASTPVYLAGRDEDAGTQGGLYYIDCKLADVSPLARDQELQRKLWSLSEKLLGITWEQVNSENL